MLKWIMTNFAEEKIISWENNNPPYEKDLAEMLGHKGGQMLAK